MAQHNQVGAWGEDIAADFMVAQGWAVVERNCRCGRVEIDLIASRGAEIAFVEVKTRTLGDDDPLQAIDLNKERRLAQAVDTYMRTHPEIHLEPRIDVIAVTGVPDDYHIDHYPDAILPPMTAL